MSSSNGPGRGAGRLHLGDDFVCLERPGFPDERRACAAGGAAYLAALRDLAPRCDGPVTAVLPAAAFAMAELGPGRLARLRARRSLARALGLGRSGLRVAAGRAGGKVCLVGLSAEAVPAVVRVLEAQGFRVAALQPAPALLPGGHVPCFPVRARSQAVLLGPFRALRRGMAAARRVWVPAGLASAAALALLVAAIGAGDGRKEALEAGPVPERAVPADADLAVAVPKRKSAPEAAVGPPEVQASAPAWPSPRPMDRPRLALPRPEAPQGRAPAPLPPAASERPAAVMASRSVPPEIREAALAAVASAAELRGGEGLPRVAVLAPVPRPVTTDAGAAPAPASGSKAESRPLPRPGGPAAARPEAGSIRTVAAYGADGRPRPRPSGASDRLALAVEAAIAAAMPSGSATAAGGSASGIRPEPRSFAAAGRGVRVTPPIQPPSVGASPVSPVQVRSAPVQVARAEPPRPVAPAMQAQPVRQDAPVRTVSQGSGTVALIGVFGTSSRRHALVRLPNGSIQRVRPGDAVNGVQIAAVGEDSVRVKVNGRDGVLRLPD